MAAKKNTKVVSRKRSAKKLNVSDKSFDSPHSVETKQLSSSTTSATDVLTAHQSLGFPLVGIGASAGGLEALQTLFNAMPADTGMAFVVVTHQHPGHISMLPELLAKETEMPVLEAADGLKVEPNRVYVEPPGGCLAILNGTLHRMGASNKESPKLPIDYFFRSLAEDQKERAICIILSGTGTDGTLGLKAIKGDLGMAMVEQPQSAKYAGMPSSAIATGLADYVLPPDAMPKQLIAYAKGLYLNGHAVAAESPAVSAEPMQKLFVLMRNRTGHDFSSYKNNTLRRRIERRMNVHQINTISQYVRYLQENLHEIDILFKELLISVTNFFRDPPAWGVLETQLQYMIQSQPDHYTLRVWVPGCATGEEAYSVAIALRRCMETVNRHLDVQIFGTDLDIDAIETARAGQYPDGIAVDVSPDRLERCFLRDDGAYRIRKEIREMVIFAQQNVIKDPPFTTLDMISCRNLMIYLNSDLQTKLLPIFHYALKPDGLLFLGPSETIGSFTDLFESLDKRWKIFRRKGGTRAIHGLPQIPASPIARDARPAVELAATAPSFSEAHVSTLIEQLLLNRFVPASVVASDRGDIIYIHGRTGRYLEPAPGRPRNNIMEMAREGLQIELAAAMRECVTTNKEVVREDICVKNDAETTHLDLTVTTLHEPEAMRGLLLVTFRCTPMLSPGATNRTTQQPKTTGDRKHFEQLERELQYMKESRQTMLEALEASNEELKSTNEELQSTNEELQSTNEELETSKEEMQSLNEELTTVNAELQAKLEDLSQANDDMQNLLNSTNIATVFLDNELHIKRFTEQAKDLIMLRQTDIGRPVSELASNLDHDDLLQQCHGVLKTLAFEQREVCTRNGKTYLMRITPYRTVGNVIDGLVLTFVNIDQLKQSQREAGEAEATRSFFESIVQTVRHPLLVLDATLRIELANDAFCYTFQIKRDEVQGQLIYELESGQWNIPKLRELLDTILPDTSVLNDFAMQCDYPHIGHRVFLLSARQLRQKEGMPGMILLAFEDVTGK